jgi:CRISPR system Cascade subunit CasC
MKIEIHLLQNFAPSCLNRDDTGSPKQCEFGGVTRARISSQCFKRAVREHFRMTGSVEVGERTKRLKQTLIPRVSTPGRDVEVVSAALDIFLDACYSKMDNKRNGDTAVLLYLAAPEIDEAAVCFDEHWGTLSELAQVRLGKLKTIEGETDKKRIADAKKQADAVEFKPDKALLKRLRTAGLSPDVALFGRMLAEQPEMNVDASCQVAHALSTHGVSYDMDFYTAVDDLNPEGATGAGMMGHSGFNSACLYRYALVDVDQLSDEKHLRTPDSARTAVRAFLEAFVHSIPTGKQNSMAAHNPPEFGMFVVRDGGVPVSLANAFAKPVTGGENEDLIGNSVEKLANHWKLITGVYGEDGVSTKTLFHLGYGGQLGELNDLDAGSLRNAINKVMAAVNTESAE